MEYGFESTPREPFAYRVCPWCGKRSFAVYESSNRFLCQSCGVSGILTRLPMGEYPEPPLIVDVHPSKKGQG